MATEHLTGIAVVVFDLDDTLYSERQFVHSGFQAVGRWLREHMDCPSDPAARMWELFQGGLRGRIFDQLLEEWRCTQTQTWLPQMVECYRNHEPKIRLYPDAAEAIGRWHLSFQLSLISDGPVNVQRNKLKALDLASCLKPIVLTDQWGEQFRKPHPRAFEAVQEETGHHGRECLYIGDNLSKDFVAPRGLGWRTVHISRPDGVYAQAQAPENGSPEHQISSFGHLELRPS